MAARGSPGRIGGAGHDPELAALLTVGVDLSGLDRGLDEGRRRTASALGDMGRSVDRFSRGSRAGLQNFAFQVQDIAVQIAGGQGAIRALSQNLPQLLGGFGLMGAAIGAAVAILGGFAQALLASGDDAQTTIAKLENLEKTINALAEAYRTASESAQGFAGAKLEFTAQEELEDLQTRLEGVTKTFTEALNAFQTRRGGGAIDPETVGSIQALGDALVESEISAIEFRREIEAIAQTLPEVTGDRIRDLAERMIDAAVEANKLKEAISELQQGIEIGGLAKLRADIVDLKNELTVAELPEELRAMAEAAANLGVDLAGGGLEKLTEETRNSLTQLQEYQSQLDAVKQSEKDAEKAARDHAAELKKTADTLQDLTDRTAALRAERAALQAGGPGGAGAETAKQVQDLASAAQRFGLTIEALKSAPPAIREAVQALVEELAAIRAVENAFKDQEKAAAAAQKQQIADTERLIKANLDFIEELERSEQAQRRRRGERIEAGGRLPDEIDVANLAAAELSTTLTDLDNLSFASLGEAFASITQQIAQAIIQALIFRAIMAAVGGGAGLFGGSAVGAASVTAIPRAQHGAVFSRGQMALMTGAISGAALLEGAGDEAAMPLTRTRSGDLGVRVEGGGRGGDTYNLVAERIDPGTVSWLLNQTRRQAPNTVVNARARGQVRDQRAPF